MIWRVTREACVMFAGQSAAILQIAHPRVALGVWEHSDFRENSAKRLMTTLDACHDVTFGTREQAEEVRRMMAKWHAPVRGNAAAAGVGGPEKYSADEPELRLWVLSTLIQGALDGYELVFGKLSGEERERFYREMRIFGEYFGVPREEGPENWEEFAVYYREQLESEWIASHPYCGELAQSILLPRRPWWMRVAAWPALGLACEFIPGRVGERLGIEHYRWPRWRQWLLYKVLPPFYRAMPGFLRWPPPYRWALRELGARPEE